MCGIAGIVDHGGVWGSRQLGEIAARMRDTMVHRGPDDAGVWVDPSGICALAHRRLSIIDLRPEGRQPMDGIGTPVQVTFNGEIYNYRELRAGLAASGTQFRTDTDTEVLPHLFREMDPASCRQLDGMYGFGAWHPQQRRLLLARDPFGKKPLYYAQGRGWFAFSSEMQALRAVPGFDETVDRDALSLYLLLQYVPQPWAMLRGARKLAPGSWLELTITAGGEPRIRLGRHYEFRTGQPADDRTATPGGRVDTLGSLVQRAVAKRLVSDVPLGAFLSGGVDSSLVCAIAARQLDRPLRTFSIGFEGTSETEHHFAREVAELLGTEHHERMVRPDAVELAAEIAARLDEPNGDSSCLPTLLLSQHARQHVTVALSGDGGDELFGGYSRYVDTVADAGSWKIRLARSIRQRRPYRAADAYLSPRWLTSQPEQVIGLMGDTTAALAICLEQWRRQLNSGMRPLVHRLRELDVNTYLPGAVLPKVDRMSMQCSLEVRCPLLDREVASFAATLSDVECLGAGNETKRLLKTLTKRYLPATIVDRQKMGFGLPSNSWSREQVLGLVADLLLANDGRLREHLDGAALRAWVDRQREPARFSIYQVWPFLIAELWLRQGNPAAAAYRG